MTETPTEGTAYFHGVLNVPNTTVPAVAQQQNQLARHQGAHLPVQAINNNITVNVNLNVTADDAEQQKKIAQEIVQAAAQSIPQQVVATRQTPFTQFMTDQGIVTQSVTNGL